MLGCTLSLELGRRSGLTLGWTQHSLKLSPTSALMLLATQPGARPQEQLGGRLDIQLEFQPNLKERLDALLKTQHEAQPHQRLDAWLDTQLEARPKKEKDEEEKKKKK